MSKNTDHASVNSRDGAFAGNPSKNGSQRYVPPHLRHRPVNDCPVNDRPEAPPSRFRHRPSQNSAPVSRFSRQNLHNPPRAAHQRSATGGRYPRRVHPDLSLEPNDRLEGDLFGDVQQGLEMNTGIDFDKYDDIPVESTCESSNEEIPPPRSKFEEMEDLPSRVVDNLRLAGYKRPTPIQKHSLPIAMAGRDVMACAQTGSGKTAAFLVPAIARILNLGGSALGEGHDNSGGYRSRRMCYPLCLVLSPTRELAMQIHVQARRYLYCTGMRAVVCYGGQKITDQFREMEQGCHVIVGTPGRLNDMLERGRLGLSQLRFVIFDEADRMLDMGFEPQIRQICQNSDMPPTEQRTTMMFSATFPSEIQRLAWDFLKRDYVFITVGVVGSTVSSITQRVEYVHNADKMQLLLHLLEECEGLTLIFVATKRSADQIEFELQREAINATSIHGDRSQGEREYALREFRSQRCPVLVATDVASRGLDIPNVLCVINYDMPSNIDDYVHRIGRTGRCGNLGTSITMVNETNKNVLPDLRDKLTGANQEVPKWFDNLVESVAWGARRKGGNRSRGFQRDARRKGGQTGGAAQPRGGQTRSQQGDRWGNSGGGYGGSYGGSRDAW